MKERTTEQMIKKCYELGKKYGVDSCKKKQAILQGNLHVLYD